MIQQGGGPIAIEVINGDTDPNCDTLVFASYDSQSAMGATIKLVDSLDEGAPPSLLYIPRSDSVGTDYVGFPIVEGAREFALLVEAGLTPMQAIQAGTRVNAELLQWEDRIGTIEAGKLADLIAVDGNPLEDLSELQRVSFVMSAGQVIRND